MHYIREKLKGRIETILLIAVSITLPLLFALPVMGQTATCNYGFTSDAWNRWAASLQGDMNCTGGTTGGSTAGTVTTPGVTDPGTQPVAGNPQPINPTTPGTVPTTGSTSSNCNFGFMNDAWNRWAASLQGNTGCSNTTNTNTGTTNTGAVTNDGTTNTGGVNTGNVTSPGVVTNPTTNPNTGSPATNPTGCNYGFINSAWNRWAAALQGDTNCMNNTSNIDATNATVQTGSQQSAAQSSVSTGAVTPAGAAPLASNTTGINSQPVVQTNQTGTQQPAQNSSGNTSSNTSLGNTTQSTGINSSANQPFPANCGKEDDNIKWHHWFTGMFGTKDGKSGMTSGCIGTMKSDDDGNRCTVISGQAGSGRDGWDTWYAALIGNVEDNEPQHCE